MNVAQTNYSDEDFTACCYRYRCQSNAKTRCVRSRAEHRCNTICRQIWNGSKIVTRRFLRFSEYSRSNERLGGSSYFKLFGVKTENHLVYELNTFKSANATGIVESKEIRLPGVNAIGIRVIDENFRSPSKRLVWKLRRDNDNISGFYTIIR